MNTEYFPDGTQISEWFYEAEIPNIEDFENKYVVEKGHIDLFIGENCLTNNLVTIEII